MHITSYKYGISIVLTLINNTVCYGYEKKDKY